MQEQSDMIKKPNLPADEYWINNKNNSFRKGNVQPTVSPTAGPVPNTGVLPGGSVPNIGMRPLQNNTGTMPTTTTNNMGVIPPSTRPDIGTMPMGVPPRAKTGPVVSNNMMHGGMAAGLSPSITVPMPGMIPASPQPSGSLPPGSYMTADMMDMQGVGTGQLQARCGVITDIGYTQGFLRTQIGKNVKIEFLIGTNMFIDREGILVDVGIDYLIINEVQTDDYLLCDMYSIKFVRIYY